MPIGEGVMVILMESSMSEAMFSGVMKADGEGASGT